MRSFLLLAFASSALAACSPFDPDLGGTSYKCGNVDPKCPGGYTCQQVGMDMRCVSDDGPGPDAPISGFQCAQDSFETTNTGGTNNDTTATPFVLTMPTFSLGPVGLCPAGDKDTYAVDIVNSGSAIDATVTWETGTAVNVAILNGGGTTIKPGTADGTNTNHAYADLGTAVGRFYVQVSAAATVQNNYRLKVTVSQ